MTKKVILDVDTGIDDALAILLAVQSGQMDMLGITTTSGNVSLEQATKNTLKVLKLLGQEGRIPVIRGAAGPLLRKPYFEHNVHGEDGLGGALAEMEVALEDNGFAADFLIEQAFRYPGELTLILTAPLTNLAIALKKCPELSGLIQEAIIMGGVALGYGNVTPTAEYNMYVDPEAARLVLHSGIPITLVGLDVTRQALLSEELLEEMAGTILGDFTAQTTAHYMERYSKRYGVKACALHDPLAVGVALDKSLVKTSRLYVDVETRSELCDGQIVCDFQNRLGREPNADVCLEVDAPRFLRLFVDLMRRNTPQEEGRG